MICTFDLCLDVNLSVTCAEGDTEIAELLLKGSDTTTQRELALATAIKTSNVEIASMLLSYATDVNTIDSSNIDRYKHVNMM